MPENDQKLYRAIVWRGGPDQLGERVSILANDATEAKRLLEEKYGKGHVYNLHNEKEAQEPR